MPLVQHPGLSAKVHSPTAALQWPTLHARPLSLQSASAWQQPGWATPLQAPDASQISLNVQALLSLQYVPGLADQAVGLLFGKHNSQPFAGLNVLLPTHWPSMMHQPGSVSDLHWPSVASQAAISHRLGLGHVTAVLAQLPLPRSQASVVHKSPSSQSALPLQHPGILTMTHWPKVGSHVGVSHGPAALQSVSFVQQSGRLLQLS